MLIDKFMPEYDVTEQHAILIDAPVSTVYAALRTTDFGRPFLVKAMLALRAWPSALIHPKGLGKSNRHKKIKFDTFLQNGFAVLSEEPEREIVLGLVGRFWTSTGCLEETDAARFTTEYRPGLSKSAWNFAFEHSGRTTVVTTETRVQCTDHSSRRKFRNYWFFVRPFSALLRQYMLKEMKRESEV
jgi:hypothetical protein